MRRLWGQTYILALATFGIAISPFTANAKTVKTTALYSTADTRVIRPISREALTSINVATVPEFAFLNMTARPATIEDWVTHAVVRARYFLREAFVNAATPEERAIFHEVHQRMGGINVHLPPKGFDFTGCRENILAFMMVGTNDVYVCMMPIRDQKFSTLDLAQTLIHEGAHVAGFVDECDATHVEVASMRKSSVGLQFQNGYWQRCGQK